MIFFCGIQILAVASQRPSEYIIIRNNSNRNIIINHKFHVEAENGQVEIEGLRIGIRIFLNDVIPPGKENICIVYYPSYGLLEAIEKRYYERLAAISIIDKLKFIFRDFSISDIEGKVLYNITDAKEDDFIIERYHYSTHYILEISD